MKINSYIQKLDYPEYTKLSFERGKVNLARHSGLVKKYDYILAQDKVLIERIAKRENLQKENVLITAGADSALHHIAEVFLTIGKVAVIPVPEFGRFEFHTKVMGAEAFFVRHTKFPYSFDLKKITRAVKQKQANVLFLANPNNPTGELFSKERLVSFIKANTQVLIVVDEVLVEERGDSVAGLVNKFSNLVVVKSFSKLFGLPGLRVGYILANSSLVKLISRTVSPYEVSSVSILLVKRILKAEKSLLVEKKKELQNARTYLKKRLKLPLTKTQAAVGLISSSSQSISLFDYLLERGILTVVGRSFRGLEKTNSVRVVIESREDMKKLVAVLSTLKVGDR